MKNFLFGIALGTCITITAGFALINNAFEQINKPALGIFVVYLAGITLLSIAAILNEE